MKRGEIRWYTFRLPDKRRPVLILTRNDVIDRLNGQTGLSWALSGKTTRTKRRNEAHPPNTERFVQRRTSLKDWPV